MMSTKVRKLTLLMQNERTEKESYWQTREGGSLRDIQELLSILELA